MKISSLAAHRIEKPSILITSIGRTGTQFFVRLFTELIPESTAVHEPDIVQGTGVDNRLAHYLLQVRRAGIVRMVFLKALGKWTLVNLSDSRFLGRRDEAGAVRDLVTQRRAFVNEMPGPVYVEANIGYYGLLDIMPAAFNEHRAIYLVRDGRDWVRSHMNWGEFYGKRGLRALISHKWPTARGLAHDPYRQEWRGLSRFEQLCWAWARLNEFAWKALPKNPHARVFHFEKVFSGEQRYQNLNDLVAFAASLPGLERQRLGPTDGWLQLKIHESAGGFPPWDNWTPVQRRQFETICGPLMERLGYAF